MVRYRCSKYQLESRTNNGYDRQRTSQRLSANDSRLGYSGTYLDDVLHSLFSLARKKKKHTTLSYVLSSANFVARQYFCRTIYNFGNKTVVISLYLFDDLQRRERRNS